MIEFDLDPAWNGSKLWETPIARLGDVVNQDTSSLGFISDGRLAGKTLLSRIN
jgi:hypothetical protein